MAEQISAVLIAAPAQRIAANGLVPTHLPVPADLPTDTVDARRFTHPCLGERVVIRLVPDVMADGAALEMARMGFSLAGFADDIARRRRQALGFPAQALMIDPGRAHLALDRMDRFRAEVARVSTKPGHARDGFTALAEELEGVAPHFLPSFWEQAGRAFMEQGNLQFAASCFDRARAAERAHGLTVEAGQQADAWLEFALGGALTVKALQAHGKELAAQGREGFLRFLDLCARRTLGGLQPWAAMLTDLRRAAKVAKVPQAECDDALLSALIGAPVLAKATGIFWKELREPLVALARRDAHVRARLLTLLPTPSDAQDGFEEMWLKLLDDSGALAALEQEGPPSGTLAAWVGRYAAQWRHLDAFLLLFRRLAPRLAAAGDPLDLFGDEWRGADAMLVDEALERGVPLAIPARDAEHRRLNLDTWAEDYTASLSGAAELPLRAQRRTLEHIAAHPGLRSLLIESIGNINDAQAFHSAAKGLPTMAAARLEAALGLAEDLEVGGVRAIADRISVFNASAFDLLQAEFPEVRARLETIRPAAALATSLRLGTLAELTWPAWEDTYAALCAGGSVEVCGTPSAPILSTDIKAVVLGADGPLLTHDVHQIDGSAPDAVAYADGQLLCSVWAYPKRKAYWSGDVTRILEFDDVPSSGAVQGHPGPSGGLVLGLRELRAGDSAVGDQRAVLSDGHGFWAQEAEVWRPFDPRSGQFIDGPPPAWAQGAAGWPLELRAVPAGAHGAAVGCAGGVYGFRAIEVEGGRRYARADGLSITATGEQTRPEGILTLPEGGAALGLDVGWRGTVTAYEPGMRSVLGDSESGAWSAGWAAVPPFTLWHFLRPRDPEGSRALRAVTEDQAAALITAAVAHPKDEGADAEALLARVAALLPAVQAPALRAAVAAWARAGAQLARDTAALLRGERAGEGAEGEDEAADGLSVAPDSALSAIAAQAGIALAGNGGDLGLALLDIAQLRVGEVARPHTTTLRWEEIGERWRAMLFVGSVGTDEQRAALAAAFEAWAQSGLVGTPTGLRRVLIHVPGRAHPMAQVADPDTSYCRWPASVWVYTVDDHRYMCTCDQYDDDGWDIKAIEVAGASGFAVPPGATLKEELPLRLPARAEDLLAAAAALRAHGARPVTDADVSRLAERAGIPVPAARLLLWGHPRGVTWRTDALGPELRGRIGMKVADVKLADQALTPGLAWVDALKSSRETQMFIEAVPAAEPGAIWTDPDAFVDRLGAAWRAAVGARISVPDELLKAATAVGSGLPDFLELLLNPPAAPRWTVPVPHEVSADGVLWKGERPLSSADLDAALLGVLWLIYNTPAGHSTRAALAGLVDDLLAAARSPHFAIDLGSVYLWEAKEKARAEAVYKAIDAEERTLTAGEGESATSLRYKANDVLMVYFNAHFAQGYLWPGRARGVDDPLVRAGLGVEPDVSRPAFARWAAVCSPDFAAAVARALDPAVPAGSWDQDPRRSAPDVVAAVMQALALSEDSATLYLQVLALPDPTKKKVLEWNGWKAPAYAKAEAPLLAQGLLTAGKRPRAGRDHFLPGGWDARSAPDLPLEKWKLPLYSWDVGGVAVELVEPLLPACSIGALFQRAWARVRAGDTPRLGGE